MAFGERLLDISNACAIWAFLLSTTSSRLMIDDLINSFGQSSKLKLGIFSDTRHSVNLLSRCN